MPISFRRTYSTTFNSRYGINFDFVGVDFTSPVFSGLPQKIVHGALKNFKHTIIHVHPGEHNVT